MGCVLRATEAHVCGGLPQVTAEGTFLDVRTIGRFCYEDDLLTLSAVSMETQAEGQPGFPRLYTDKTINSLKHRLLVYLWRRAEQDGSAVAKRRCAPPTLSAPLSPPPTLSPPPPAPPTLSAPLSPYSSEAGHRVCEHTVRGSI